MAEGKKSAEGPASEAAIHGALGKSVYSRLDDSRLSPESTHDEVLDIALDLQMNGRFNAETRAAWDQLRTLPERLAVDFFLFDLECPNIEQRCARAISESRGA